MKKEEIEEARNKRIHEMCNMIVRQTNLSYEEANKHSVIKNYIGRKEKQVETDKSVNQKIYSEIRNFMDDTSEKYEARKQQAQKMEIIKQLRENQKINNENNEQSQNNKEN